MMPTVVLDPRGRLSMVLGSPGGATIISAVLQVILNVVDHDMSLAEAVYAPRIHHNALPDSVFSEQGGLTPQVRARLEAMGHRFAQDSSFMATVSAIRVTRSGLEGVTDPRLPSRAAGF